jgi:hypothetical protein
MTPFEEFRLWLRQGAGAERAIAAIAAVLALALVAWVIVPAGNSTKNGREQVAASANPGSNVQSGAAGTAAGSSSDPAAASATGGSSVAGTARGTSSGSTASGVRGSGIAGQSGVDGTGSACGTGTDQGVTATTVSIAVILLDIAGGNSVIGVPEPGEQQKEHQAVIDALNNKGGLLCRKIVPKYYTDNPLDSNSEHSICLDIVAAKVFATIGGLYQAENAPCLPQNKIPTYTQTQRPTSEMKKFAPYFFSFYADSDTDFRTLVAGAKAQNFFDGMTKLGVVIYDCFPEYWPQLQAALGRAGIPSSKFETFNYGCPPGGIVVPPSTVASAVLQFQRDGVDRVMSAGPNLASFSSQAQGQGYHPKYAVSDIDTTMTLSPSNGFHPDTQNFDGAIDISNSQYGATNTPGVPLSPETVNCNDMLTKGKTAWKAQDGDGYAGGVCNQWNMLVLGATRGGALLRSGLAAGMNKVGYFYQSFPGAPALWNDPLKTWAGPYYRPLRFEASCDCWKVINATWSDAAI